jgi:hypothetical protein
MGEINAVIGQAGTGKTTWLMQQAEKLSKSLIWRDHQRLLAITRMHGSRRRLQLKLIEYCPSTPFFVTTIDSFALSILNKWRRSLGYEKPIQPVDYDSAFSDTLFGIEADFINILVKSTKLLRTQTVQNVIRESYPIVMIDEFQDCHGALLDFIEAVLRCSTLIAAADEFQFLDGNVAGCPAVDWLLGKMVGSSNQCVNLAKCHRTSVRNILAAAQCLRNNHAADAETIPVFYCQGHGIAAFKIMEALVFNARSWRGSTAIICPSHDDFLQKVLNSLDNQLRKKNLKPFIWSHECAIHKEQKDLYRCLGLTGNDTCSKDWAIPAGNLTPIADQIVARTKRYSRLKGLQEIPYEIIARHIDLMVHERRAYCAYSPKRVVTTVHGAKNREFDNVIIIWPYKVPPGDELKRRLLYNAITRSKNNCILLVRGDLQRINNDPVLSLLGPAKPAFTEYKKMKASKAVRKRKGKKIPKY